MSRMRIQSLTVAALIAATSFAAGQLPGHRPRSGRTSRAASLSGPTLWRAMGSVPVLPRRPLRQRQFGSFAVIIADASLIPWITTSRQVNGWLARVSATCAYAT